MLVGGRSLAPPGQSQWTPRRDKSQPQVLLPNPRLRKRFKPQTTRNTRKNGTLPRISRIPRFSRPSLLAACLNPQHFAPSCRGQPPLGEDLGSRHPRQDDEGGNRRPATIDYEVED